MKLIVFKKSIFIALAAVLLGGAALGIFCGIAASPASSVMQKTVVIDAGHGGIDAGVHGKVTDIKESDINLAIAKQLKGYFANAGFNAVLTRKNNGGLYGLSTKGFKADMVIPVHQNFCPIPSKRGSTVFFDKSSESGIALANTIQKQLNALNDKIKPNEALAGDYYMLKCTSNPSVIVECGFLSNAEDEKLLITEEYQKAIAYAIFKGAVSYYC